MTTNKDRTGVRSLCADSKNYLEEDHAAQADERGEEKHQAFWRWNRLVRQERERQARKAKDQAESGGRKK